MIVRARTAAGIVPLLALCACGGSKDPPPGKPLDCRMRGAARFEPICTVERTSSPDGTVLVVRAPDGGFRRFLVVRDGRGVMAADGAEPVRVRPDGPRHIEVTAGDMNYRLPAVVRP